MEELEITEYEGQRVLTSQQIADAYETDSKILNNNFNRNKDRYVEGKHYICLQGDELKGFKTNHQFDESSRINKLYLWTEKGALLHAKSLNTDKAWEVYDRLVESYFRVRNLSNDLSPQLQLFQQMFEAVANQERTVNEAKQLAQKAVETTESIKEAVKPVFDNWREVINKKFNRIQRNSDYQFNVLRTTMYAQLEQRARCDLSTRLRNKKERMRNGGCTKTEIEKLTKMDIIESDSRLREIFSKIVTEYEIKYCA